MSSASGVIVERLGSRAAWIWKLALWKAAWRPLASMDSITLHGRLLSATEIEVGVPIAVLFQPFC